MPCCVAVNCSNRHESGFVLYRFPRNVERRAVWALKVKRGNWKPTDSSYLCEVHFDASQFELNRQDGAKRLKPNAVPLLFHHVPVKFARKLPMKRSPHTSPSKQFVKPRVIFEHAYESGMSSPAATTSSTTTSSLSNNEVEQLSGSVAMNGILDDATESHHHHHLNGTASVMKELPVAPPHYPAHFMKGSVIQLADGELRRVEELCTDDFIKSADVSPDLCLDTSTVISLMPLPDRGTVMVELSIGEQGLRVSVESTMEHPFFVYNRGWSSFSPARTSQRYELPCGQLQLGDRCISLTQKSSNAKHHAAASDKTSADLKSAGSFLSVLSSSVGADALNISRSRVPSDSVFQFLGKSS